MASEDPIAQRRSLLGRINTLKDKDPNLWGILRELAFLENDVFNNVQEIEKSIVWILRVPVKITDTGTDLVDYWPRVYIPRDSDGNMIFSSMRLKAVGISAKPKPTSNLVMDVQYSRDGGVNFTSVFNSATFFKLPTGNQTIQYGTNTVGTLFDKDILRFDCSDNGGSDNVEIYLQGFFK